MESNPDESTVGDENSPPAGEECDTVKFTWGSSHLSEEECARELGFELILPNTEQQNVESDVDDSDTGGALIEEVDEVEIIRQDYSKYVEDGEQPSTSAELRALLPLQGMEVERVAGEVEAHDLEFFGDFAEDTMSCYLEATMEASDDPLMVPTTASEDTQECESSAVVNPVNGWTTVCVDVEKIRAQMAECTRAVLGHHESDESEEKADKPSAIKRSRKKVSEDPMNSLRLEGQYYEQPMAMDEADNPPCCVLCKLITTDPVMLNCGHILCTKCLSENLIEDWCPECLLPFTANSCRTFSCPPIDAFFKSLSARFDKVLEHGSKIRRIKRKMRRAASGRKDKKK